MEAKEMIIKDLLKMQEKTAKCNGLVAGMVAQTWVIRMLGDKIREYGGEPYVLEKNLDGNWKMVRDTKNQEELKNRGMLTVSDFINEIKNNTVFS